MVRTSAALLLLVAFAAVTFGWRTWVQVRRHGDTGWRMALGGGPVAVIAHVAFALSMVLALAAPVAALVTGEPHRPGGVEALVDGPLGATAGVVGALLLVCGTALVVSAQVQMGASWRIGVDSEEVTELVTTGLFTRVRNPIFTGMGVGVIGLALMVPNVLALATVVAAVVGLHLQVRHVEEPYLRDLHGVTYEEWASTAGRFLPGLGRFSPR